MAYRQPYTNKEKEFLKKFANLCEEYDIVLISEDYPYVGVDILSAPDKEKDPGAYQNWDIEMSRIKRGFIDDRNYVIGHRVVFRDTGETGLITGVYYKFAEFPDYEAVMEDGTVKHFTDTDNYYTI